MGFQSQSSTSRPTFNFRYSAFLGMLYLSTKENEQAINEVKGFIGGQDVVRQGYVGNGSEAASGKALAMLKDRGVNSVKLFGELRSVSLNEKDVQGTKVTYLNVGLSDADGRYYVSVDLGGPTAQMLVRKLVNAEIGAQTALSMFATYEQKEGKSKAYAEHGVSLKQGADAGVEVKGISPMDVLKGRKDEALAALDKLNITDSKVRNAQIAAIELAFHKELIEGIKAKVDAFYAARGQKADVPAENTAE